MDIVGQILLQAGQTLAGLLILLSILVSGLILFKPSALKQINGLLQKGVSTDHMAAKIHARMDISQYVYKNRNWLSPFLLIGSVYIIYYFLSGFDRREFILALAPEALNSSIHWLIFLIDFMKWLFLVFAFFGLTIAILLGVFPSKLKNFEDAFDLYWSSKGLEDSINISNNSIDAWVLKNHTLIGLPLLVSSCFLAVFFFYHFF